jgi:hypothetical protein
MLKLIKCTPGVAILVAALVAAPAAYARLDPPLTPQQQHRIQAYQQAVTKSFGSTPGGLAGPVVPVVPVGHDAAIAPEASPQPSFHWDDAGIGAGIMLMLLGAGAGVVAIGIRRRGGSVRQDHGPGGSIRAG